ncbi:hypothetical protein BVER_00851c [Candidatus Burkholderia verschuerenii]|uniref:Uncharacterized protein n=1 Tax=Candidatus Burkholderia verschuerenii TaxID=242163 RepID=A0A0L0MG81_9BURK|nr:hypothetical protein [Candidatus Burkholderia verschuerenii]KND60974.1 hypothetical protein BVER_00851c [Candidatus Burkholderia verschuerenii]
MQDQHDTPELEHRAEALAAAVRQLRKFGFALVSADTAADDGAARYEQARRAASALLGLADDGVYAHATHAVARALLDNTDALRLMRLDPNGEAVALPAFGAATTVGFGPDKREQIDALTGFLPRLAGVALDVSQQDALRAMLTALPKGASMLYLLQCIREKSPEKIGITPEQYSTLEPLLIALAKGFQ